MKYEQMGGQMLSKENGIKEPKNEIKDKDPKNEIKDKDPKDETKDPREGLGAEKNRQVAEYLKSENYDGLLQVISQEADKKTACEVIQRSAFEFNKGGRANSLNKLIETALGDVQLHGDAIKELVLYSFRNNLQGERFWRNPNKNETLFIDDDRELISFQGEIGTLSGGENEGMNYIKSLGKYEVLTGPNAGKIFDGSDEARQRRDPLYRPIKGPEMKA